MRFFIYLSALAIIAGLDAATPIMDFKYAAIFFNDQSKLGIPLPLALETTLRSSFIEMLLERYSDFISDSVIKALEDLGFVKEEFENGTSVFPEEEDMFNNTVILHTSDDYEVNLLTQERPNCFAHEYAKEEYLRSYKFLNKMTEYQSLFTNLTENFRQNITNFKDIRNLYIAFRIHIYYDLDLNDKMPSVDPDVFHDAACFGLSIPTNSIAMARYKSGPVLKRVFKRMHAVDMSMTDVKLDFFQTDDRGIVSILNALNIYDNNCPLDFATIYMDVYKTETGTTLVQISYQNDVNYRAVPIILPGCEMLCPLENFTNLYGNLIPFNWEEECNVRDISIPRVYTDVLTFTLVLFVVVYLSFIHRKYTIRVKTIEVDVEDGEQEFDDYDYDVMSKYVDSIVNETKIDKNNLNNATEIANTKEKKMDGVAEKVLEQFFYVETGPLHCFYKVNDEYEPLCANVESTERHEIIFEDEM